MKVIGAGLPRTATLSQKIALESLGFAPCYHMVSVLSDLDQAPLWRAALDGTIGLDSILADYEATVDWPGSFFYRDLIDIYPEARVVLSVRDDLAWARSMHDTIWGLFYDDVLMRHLSQARASVDEEWSNYMSMMREMWERSGLIEGEDTTLESMAAAVARYNQEVQETVPADRLLVWRPEEGWEPLCAFLDVPVPDSPFPRVNDAREFEARIIAGSLSAIERYRGVLAETDLAAVAG